VDSVAWGQSKQTCPETSDLRPHFGVLHAWEQWYAAGQYNTRMQLSEARVHQLTEFTEYHQTPILTLLQQTATLWMDLWTSRVTSRPILDAIAP